MEILCRAVFVPLAVVLLVLAFHDGARERVLNLRGIARLERRLTLSNKGYWVAFGLLFGGRRVRPLLSLSGTADGAESGWLDGGGGGALSGRQRNGSIRHELADLF